MVTGSSASFATWHFDAAQGLGGQQGKRQGEEPDTRNAEDINDTSPLATAKSLHS
ncbi:hypothetical protein ACRAWD_05960 [Caulobacter segnis]